MKLGNLVKHINHSTASGEIIAIENGRVRVEWDSHTSWHDPEELTVLIGAEEGLAQLEEMFNHYHADEYLPAFEAIRADYERVCKENREMRNQLHKEARKSA